MIKTSSNNTWLKWTFFACYLISMYLSLTEILYVGLLMSYIIVALGVYVIYLTQNAWPPLIKSLLLMAVLLFFYFLLTYQQVYIPYKGLTVDVYKDVILPYLQILSMIVVMYYMGKYKIVNDKILILFFVLLVPFTIYKYIDAYRSVAMLQNKDVSIGELTNSAGYLFTGLLPYLFLFKRKILPIALFGCILYGVMLSGKRGAIILVLLFAVWYFYENYLRGKMSVTNIVLGIVLIFGSYYLINELLLNNDFIYNRYEMTLEGNSSSRDMIVNKVLSGFWGQESLFGILFGGGIGQSVRYAGNWAHNEWLEFLSMSGFFGVSIYLSIYYTMMKEVIKYSQKSVHKNIFIACSLMVFVKSFYSMSFFLSGINLFPLYIIMGYSFGVMESNDKRVA